MDVPSFHANCRPKYISRFVLRQHLARVPPSVLPSDPANVQSERKTPWNKMKRRIKSLVAFRDDWRWRECKRGCTIRRTLLEIRRYSFLRRAWKRCQGPFESSLFSRGECNEDLWRDGDRQLLCIRVCIIVRYRLILADRKIRDVGNVLPFSLFFFLTTRERSST